MSRIARPQPVDPHDLRLGVPKMSGSEIVPVFVTWLCWGFPLLTLGGHVHLIGAWLVAVVSTLNAASLTMWLSRWSREKQARRGVRASSGNTWDAVSVLLLGFGAGLSVFSADGLTPWVGALAFVMLVLVLVGLGRRRRRALAPTPAQLATSAFD